MAAEAGYSGSQFRRLFHANFGETPSQFQRRVAIDRAAAELMGTKRAVVDIAMAAGFESHEGFTRAFAGRFGVPPSEYRTRYGSASGIAARWVYMSSPCVAVLGHGRAPMDTEETVVSYEVTIETLERSWAVVGRRRVDRSQVGEGLAELIPMAFGYAVDSGLEMAGPPLVRYLAESAAFFEIEAGVPVAQPPDDPDHPDLAVIALPGGAAAVTVHSGPYDTLGDAHAAIDRWLANQGLRSHGGGMGGLSHRPNGGTRPCGLENTSRVASLGGALVSRQAPPVGDTDRARNLSIETDGGLSLDEMEQVLRDVASALGLTISHVTKLGARRISGNRHWHLKRDLKQRGCLDVTYWPPGRFLWVTVRRSEPKWVRSAGHRLHSALRTVIDQPTGRDAE